MTCERCSGDFWVCENHPDRPWRDGDGCSCGGAGEPCPDCNPTIPGVMPLDETGQRILPNLHMAYVTIGASQ
jgi:hypothetical protein